MGLRGANGLAVLVGLALVAQAAPAQAAESAPANDSRLSLGVESGYGAPEGSLGGDIDYYPLHWLGFEVGGGIDTFANAKSSMEMVQVSWPLAPRLEQGIGIGLAQLYVTPSTPLVDSANDRTIHYFTADCSHFTVFFTPYVAFRATLGVSVAIANGDACSSNPALCGPVGGLWANGTLFFNLDLPRHES